MSRDLLSGLLPAGDPFAPFDPVAYRAAIQPPATPRLPEPKLVATPPVPEPTLVVTPPVPKPTLGQQPVPRLDGAFLEGQKIKAVGKPRKRRRRSLAGPLMALFALLMFAGIAGCLYLLVSGRGLTTDGRIIATGSSADEQRERPALLAEAAPPADSKRPDFDPVMGTLKPSNNDPTPPKPNSEMPPKNPAPPPQPGETETTPPETGLPGVAESTSNNQGMSTRVTPGEELNSQPEKEEKVAVETALVEAANQALEELKEVLRSGRFEAMMGVVEKARPAMVTAEQEEELAQYALLVELAQYYVEGIRRGAAGLGPGEEFEISPGLMVVVVEGSRDKIALKINGRVKSYKFEELPLVLAHRLAEFALPEGEPEVVAGRAAYQALWSEATAAHRAQALAWIGHPTQASDRLDFESLAKAIDRLFQ